MRDQDAARRNASRLSGAKMASSAPHSKSRCAMLNAAGKSREAPKTTTSGTSEVRRATAMARSAATTSSAATHRMMATAPGGARHVASSPGKATCHPRADVVAKRSAVSDIRCWPSLAPGAPSSSVWSTASGGGCATSTAPGGPPSAAGTAEDFLCLSGIARAALASVATRTRPRARGVSPPAHDGRRGRRMRRTDHLRGGAAASAESGAARPAASPAAGFVDSTSGPACGRVIASSPLAPARSV
mmetsp:Transcript_67839/g.196247  ORF Transcript_67839/g.196247 Transcript_67839/m.196247 type:complete len:245 (+) Transcript_67839:844-1578(+)